MVTVGMEAAMQEALLGLMEVAGGEEGEMALEGWE